MRYFLLFHVVGLVLLAGLSGCSENKFSDTVFVNGAIYTVNSDQPWAEALATKGGVIEYVGPQNGVQDRIGPNTQVINLEGKMLLPGFHDTHLHPFAGINDFACNLSESENSQDILNTLLVCIKNGDGKMGDWLYGYGWKNELFPEGVKPHRSMLDALSYDGPILLQDQYGHSVWMNSKGLEYAGIDKLTRDPIGGVILRDANGSPTGLLRDTAQDTARDAMMANWSRLESVIYGVKGLKSGLDRISANGITSFVDALVLPDSGMHYIYYLLDSVGMLNARAQLSLWAYPNVSDDDMQLSRFKEMYDNHPDSRLRVNQIKFYVDGILGSRTAKLQQHYTGEPDNFGINYFTQDRLASFATELEPYGYQMHIHAIGDAGVHEALNALEAVRNKNGDLGRRHHLVHLEVINELDIPRFSELGVLPNTQMSYGLPSSEEDVERSYPYNNPYSRKLTPVKSFLDVDATLVLSSDWSGGRLSPLWGIQTAMTRANPDDDEQYIFEEDEIISLAEAIKAYTLNAAFLMHQEKRTGSLEPGKLADMVVLDRNLFEVPVQQIHQVSVLATYLDGELIFGQLN